MDHVGLGLVGDDDEGEVFGAGVDELVGLSGWEDEVVAGFDGFFALGGAHLAAAAEDVVGLPLRGVLMEGEIGLSGGNALDFEVKGVAAAPGAGVLLPACGDGQGAAGEAVLALRGVLLGKIWSVQASPCL